MMYKLLDLQTNKNDYLSNLMHPYFIKDIYENLLQSQHLKSFISSNTKVDTWFIFSDYCLDDQAKPNNVMTFSIFALERQSDFDSISKVLNVLQRSDSKSTSKINPNFLKFIAQLPIFNISLMLPKNRNFTKAFKLNEMEFLKMRYESLEKYYTRLQSFPIKDKDFSDYIKDFKYIQNKFKSKSVSLGMFRDIEIITSAITSIFTLISSIHSSKKLKLIWISDRDSLLTFEKANLSAPLVFTMIDASFNSFSPSSNQLGFFHHQGNGRPELDHFNRIPDIVAGTLADMTKSTVSKEKFLSVLKDYLVIQSRNHIAKIYFDEHKYGLNTIVLNKK